MERQADLRIAVIQEALILGANDINLQRFDARLEALEGRVDLVILPECFATGMLVDSDAHVEEHMGATVQWMQGWAQRLTALVCGTVAVRSGQQIYNRFYFVYPDGEAQWYDKRHLFAYGGESRLFTPGHERKIFEYRGWWLCPQVCYDLRFPVWARNRCDYDLLVYSACFPAVRDFAWQALLTARAVENQCYVAACNRAGRDAGGQTYYGNSRIIAPSGELLASLLPGEEGAILATCSLESLSEFRREFPFLAERDSFHIDIENRSQI